MNYRDLYSEFLKANEGKQHFASHSHHYWPDITLEAQKQYWLDSAKYVDDKWAFIFQEKLPALRKLIAKNLGLTKPEQICFAPNTHEFVNRLFSLIPRKQELKILSTDSEFYSFERQAARLEEENEIQVKRVPTLPFLDFEERFIQAIETTEYDMVFFSHVFFNSGMVVKNFETIVNKIPIGKIIVMDGYHGFMAVPTDLSSVEDRIFYMSGGYKYSQGGEGCCFMHVPQGNWRPRNTGWFAEIGNLGEQRPDQVAYATDGQAFAGATLDMTAMYRQLAVLEMFDKKDITVEKIHEHIQAVQFSFLKHLDEAENTIYSRKNLLMIEQTHHGHFLTFKLESNEKVLNEIVRLREDNIHVDGREDRIRFGFGMYHEPNISNIF